MKKAKIKCSLAIAAALLVTVDSASARSELWGCEVLLCLANPAGPMAAPFCVPPILDLIKALTKWRPEPFPQCKMAGGNSRVEYAPHDPYDACPAGSAPLAQGERAVTAAFAAQQAGKLAPRNAIESLYPMTLGSAPPTYDENDSYSEPLPGVLAGGALPPPAAAGATVSVGSESVVLTGIGDGSNVENDGTPKVCVSGLVGSTYTQVSNGYRGYRAVPVQVYSGVSLVYPYDYSATVRVIVDGNVVNTARLTK